MGRRTNLLDEQASIAAKRLKKLLAERGRNAAVTFLSTRLRDVPHLSNVSAKAKPTDDQKHDWRCRLLTACDASFQQYPPLCADVLTLLTKSADYATGDWFARLKLQEVGIIGHARHRTPASELLREAADWGTVDTEVMLAMGDFYNQQARATHSGQPQFDLAAYLIGRLTVGQADSGRKLDGHTTLALVNSVLRLPYRRYSAEANESMLRLALARSRQLLDSTVDSGSNNARGPKREAVWQAHIRAGIHLASHLAANNQLNEARNIFEQFDERSEVAVREYPKSIQLHGARMRLYHKWYKYEEDTEIGGRRFVRNRFNKAVKAAVDAVGREQNICLRWARFERDAGGRSLGYRLINEAIKKNPVNPWPQTVLQGWLAADRADDNTPRVKIDKTKVALLVKPSRARQRRPHHKPSPTRSAG